MLSKKVSINVELLQQNISYLQKGLTSKYETIKSLLEVRSALIESSNKTTVNEFRISRPTMEPLQNQPMPTSKATSTPKYPTIFQTLTTSTN